MSLSSASPYEVLIIGGSYAGLSAAMSLGRARRRVLVLDAGLPRNRFTPHAHNLLLHDGDAPADLAAKARQQVAHYPTVTLLQDTATGAEHQSDGSFQITTTQNGTFQAQTLLLATGLCDELPAIPGFAECWGQSVIHCPYCHGYEVTDQPTGLWLNGEMVETMATLLLNWTTDLTVFTNGPATFSAETRAKLTAWHVRLEETLVVELAHDNGQLTGVQLTDGQTIALPVLYAGLPKYQASTLPAQLGCELTEANLLRIDEQYQTTVPGVYAAGDNSSMAHQLVQAMAAGNMVGIMLSKQFIPNLPSEPSTKASAR